MHSHEPLDMPIDPPTLLEVISCRDTLWYLGAFGVIQEDNYLHFLLSRLQDIVNVEAKKASQETRTP